MKAATPPTVTSTLRSLTAPLWVLLIGTFVNTVGSFLMLYLTLYLIHKGISPYYAGIALGAWGAGRIVGAFIGGSIADRLGYRFTMAMSMLSTAIFIVGLVAAANHRDPWLVIATSLVAASVGGIWRAPAQAMITELTPADRLIMVTAFWRLTFNAGMLASPVLGAFLSRYSWDLLFWVEAGSSAVFGLFILVALPRGTDSTAPATPAEGAPPVPASNGYLQVLANRGFLLFLIAMLVNAVVYVQAPAVLGLHLDKLGHPTELFGSLVSLNALMVITLEVPVTKIMQRTQPRTAIAIGMALTGAGLSLYSAPLGLAGLIAATVVYTMGEVTASPSMMAYPGLAAPPGMRGRYIAAATVANQAGYSIGPVIGTAIWAQLGGQVFWLCGVLSVLAIAATLAGTRVLNGPGAAPPPADEAAPPADAGPSPADEAAPQADEALRPVDG